MRKFDGGLFVHITGTLGVVDVHHTIQDADVAHRERRADRTMRFDGKSEFGCREIHFTDAALRFIAYQEDMTNA